MWHFEISRLTTEVIRAIAQQRYGEKLEKEGKLECRYHVVVSHGGAHEEGSEGVPLKPRPGTYALILKCQSIADVAVGRRGHLKLQPGFYVYVGSAFGPGGIRGRLAHHIRPVSRPHWHIDYIRSETKLVEVWYFYGQKSQECIWARQLAKMTGTSVPLVGFGASDCGCKAHLYYFVEYPESARFAPFSVKSF